MNDSVRWKGARRIILPLLGGLAIASAGCGPGPARPSGSDGDEETSYRRRSGAAFVPGSGARPGVVAPAADGIRRGGFGSTGATRSIFS